NGGLGAGLVNSGTGILMAFNQAMDASMKLAPTMTELTGKLMGMAGVFITATLAGTILVGTVTALVALASPWVLAFGAVALSLQLIGASIYESKVQLADFNINMNTLAVTTENVDRILDSSVDKFYELDNIANQIGQNDGMLVMLDEASSLMGIILRDSVTFLNTLNAMKGIQAIDPESFRPRADLLPEINVTRASLAENKKGTDDIIEKIISTMTPSRGGEQRNGKYVAYKGNEQYLEYYFKLAQDQSVDIKEKDKMLAQFVKENHITDLTVREANKHIFKTSAKEVQKLHGLVAEAGVLSEKAKAQDQELAQYKAIREEQVKANEDGYNQSGALKNSLKMENFYGSNEITLGDISYKGIDG
ncbi:MAG: hypothetical protein ACRC6B_02075, partial [Fusobacteriaceae bacterium]